jgi:hypothetical protein
MIHIKKLTLIAIAITSLFSCTKLNEKLNGQLTEAEVNALSGGGAGGTPDYTSLLNSVYITLYAPWSNQNNIFALQEHTTDEMIGPTRGGDWDDNGDWRVLHAHLWDANHAHNADAFRDQLKTSFQATDLLRFNPGPQITAEAKFLRAFTNFAVLDNWDQVPYRENTTDPNEVPKIRKGSEALDYIIAEATAAITDLPDHGPTVPAFKATKNAARVLLMKCNLNKGVYANREAPTFDAADMNKVIALADEIIAQNRYTLTTNYFDNFAPNNGTVSTENIFTLGNRDPAAPNAGLNGNGAMFNYHQSLHYNSPVAAGGGWNGFTTLADFYDKFSADDKRREQSYPGVTDVHGIKVGFLIGQQYGAGGVELLDRKKNKLIFRREVHLLETDPAAIEQDGIRVVKYIPDYGDQFPTKNDWVFYRYADVLLMKAEAILRGGTGTQAAALGLVNQVRARAGLASLAAITTEALIDELAREFYWEGRRRNDLIRFGKFLEPWQDKTQSEPTRLLFPIPNRSLASNPNLTQNPGY